MGAGIVIGLAVLIGILAVVFVIAPCIVIFLINLIKGCTKGWQRRYLIPVIITGIILGLFILLSIETLVEHASHAAMLSSSSSSGSI